MSDVKVTKRVKVENSSADEPNIKRSNNTGEKCDRDSGDEPTNQNPKKSANQDSKTKDQSIGNQEVWNDEGAFELMLEKDLRLSVSKFKGQLRVDIRKLYDGKPTQKGVNMKVETFKKIIEWSTKLDETVEEVEKRAK